MPLANLICGLLYYVTYTVHKYTYKYTSLNHNIITASSDLYQSSGLTLSENGRQNAEVYQRGEHHQQILCSVGPGGGDGLHHPGSVHRPVRRESGQQTLLL